MQILAETEYQDIYRVTDGVLLVVNKFKPIKYSKPIYLYSAKTSKYNPKCQEYLKIVKSNYSDDYIGEGVVIPKGTVLYHCQPVEVTDDKLEYQYQIKTTGDAFSGNVEEIEKMLSDILYKIRCGECRH